MFSLFLVKINGERTFRAIIVDEALKLKVVAMGVSNSSQRYRALGTDLSNTIGYHFQFFKQVVSRYTLHFYLVVQT
jgi:hypothetical protein